MSEWPETNKEIENLVCFFEDDFQVSPKTKQIDRLPDTNEYIKCLEKKLEKIKGKSTKISKSKDIIESLISTRHDAMCNYLAANESAEDSFNEIDQKANLDDENIVTSNYLDKKIHPEKQALTFEEQQLLIKSDYLAIRTESS